MGACLGHVIRVRAQCVDLLADEKTEKLQFGDDMIRGLCEGVGHHKARLAVSVHGIHGGIAHHGVGPVHIARPARRGKAAVGADGITLPGDQDPHVDCQGTDPGKQRRYEGV